MPTDGRLRAASFEPGNCHRIVRELAAPVHVTLRSRTDPERTLCSTGSHGAGAAKTQKGTTAMHIRFRNVLAVGALTSGLLAGGALVANAATTSTSGNSGTSSTSGSSTTTPSSSSNSGNSGSSSGSSSELELELRFRLHQELPEHGQQLQLRLRERHSPVRIRRPTHVRFEQRGGAGRIDVRRVAPPPPQRNGRCGPDRPPGPHRPLSVRADPGATNRSTPSPPGHRGRRPPALRGRRRCAPPPRRAPAGGGGTPSSRSRPARDTRRRSR